MSLPSELLTRLKQVAATAHEMNFTLYLVGGPVRDLLLGRPNFDLDLVVEGDAVALAERLAKTHGGRVHSHSRFGTAKWIIADEPGLSTYAGMHAPGALDLISARTEFYEYPTALPAVERSSIKLDLQRRDFTINTMAICLDPDRFGQLLDPFGGRQDLERGLIRVLHNFSFIEDPTRILRAVRFEQRFGFRIESRSAELVAGAVDLLDNVSGDRLRHELFAILDEPEPERYLMRLQELGALAKIHRSLKIDEGISDQFRRLRADGPGVTALDYLAVLTRALPRVNTLEVASRLKLAKSDVLFLEQTGGLGEMERELSAREMSRSELVHRLADFQDAALELTARVTAAPEASS